ncbi:MAG: membrane protein insertion efficiency factor YidD [Phycisphaerales bacterium]
MCDTNEPSMGLAASSRVESELGWFGRVGNVPFLVLIRVYRVVLSPVIGGQCRFEPTCSLYSMEAYRLYGPVIGTRMTIGRICRCHPWNAGGFDPVRIPDGAEDRTRVREAGAQDGCLEMEGDQDGTTAGGTET